MYNTIYNHVRNEANPLTTHYHKIGEYTIFTSNCTLRPNWTPRDSPRRLEQIFLKKIKYDFLRKILIHCPNKWTHCSKPYEKFLSILVGRERL